MPRQAAAMILIRVAQQEGIDIRPTVLILLQPFAQVLGNVAHVLSGVVGVLPDVDVDQQRRRVEVAELDERHVPVINGEKRDGGGHEGLRVDDRRMIAYS